MNALRVARAVGGRFPSEERPDDLFVTDLLTCGDLDDLLTAWLGVFGSPYFLNLTDTRSPVLKLADRGVLEKYGVELTVWDVETGARFWAGRTNVLNRKQLSKGVPEFVRGVIGALVMADLV